MFSQHINTAQIKEDYKEKRIGSKSYGSISGNGYKSLILG